MANTTTTTDRDAINFFVEDTPQPGGSKRAYYNAKIGRAITAPDNRRVVTWRNSVRFAARRAYDGEPLATAVRLTTTFYFRRPKGHYGAGRNERRLKPSAPAHHTQRPDLTKLIRSTEDALKGICWDDDCRVVTHVAGKQRVHRWEREGVEVVVEDVRHEALAADLEPDT